MGIFTRSQHMGTAAVLLGIGIFLSRVMGLVRDKVISYYFGAGMEADIYLASFVVPDFINYLLAGGYFSITLIPLLAGKFTESEEAGWSFFSTILCWVCVLSATAVAVAWAFAPLLAKLTAPGFINTPERLERLTFFLRIVLPAQAFFLPGACFTALLYRRRQFASPAIMPLMYNGGIILGGLVMRSIAPERGMEGFCWGVIAGSFCGAFLLPFLVARSGGLRLTVRFTDSGLAAFIIMALPLMLGQSIAVLDEQFIRIFGSFAGVGGVSILAYARRFMFVPIGIVAQSAGAASYPFLANLAAENRKDEFDHTVNAVLLNALTVAVPLCIWMAAISEPLIRFLFEQGRFTAADTKTCALLLSLMLPGVIFWVIHQIVSRSFYAHEDTLTPAVIGTISTVAFLPAYWILAKFFGAPGVAVAGGLGVGAYTLALAWVWKNRKGGNAFTGVAALIAKAAGTGLLPGLAAWGGGIRIAGLFPGSPFTGALAAFCGASLIFAAVYIPLARLVTPGLLEPFLALAGRVRRTSA